MERKDKAQFKINKKCERKIVNISYSKLLAYVLGAQKNHINPSHWDGSFEYPQHVLVDK